VRYTYFVTGHVSNITIKDEWTGQGEAPAEYDYYYDLALYYTTHGKLWRVLWDKWLVDGQGQVIPESYEPLAAREFCYDSARQRYLDRDVDPDTWELIGAGRWTDYLAEQPYGDFTHSGTGEEQPSEQVRYLTEFGVHAQQTLSTEETRYLHGDLIRSTMLTTDESGAATSSIAYTAFGEPIGEGGMGVPPVNFGTRYQYAGAWGYESGLLSLQGANEELAPVTAQHVGARWYDPGLGRFLQRDPIGLRAGLNFYAYCASEPLTRADPRGLTICPPPDPDWDWEAFVEALITGAAGGAAAGGLTGGPGVAPGAALGGATGGIGYGAWFAAKSLCIKVWGIGDALIDWYKAEDANDRQRDSRPDVFPPARPNPVEPKKIPCGPHY
jgi:RHS repeat-associated protein